MSEYIRYMRSRCGLTTGRARTNRKPSFWCYVKLRGGSYRLRRQVEDRIADQAGHRAHLERDGARGAAAGSRSRGHSGADTDAESEESSEVPGGGDEG